MDVMVGARYEEGHHPGYGWSMVPHVASVGFERAASDRFRLPLSMKLCAATLRRTSTAIEAIAPGTLDRRRARPPAPLGPTSKWCGSDNRHLILVQVGGGMSCARLNHIDPFRSVKRIDERPAPDVAQRQGCTK
jgi:hypothetical protein